jgi:Holliday junction DNA helicase RuvA
MIAHLSGTMMFASDRFIVVDVNGIGYKVRIALGALRTIRGNTGSRVELWTHLVVREDALDLYGFQHESELEFFEMLIGVSGIGPKSALGILNIAAVDHLKQAIAQGDVAALTKVSGIGTKSAQKIILELKDKLGGHEGQRKGGALQEEHDAIEGLAALGYSTREARDALHLVPATIIGPAARIKEALKKLGK